MMLDSTERMLLAGFIAVLAVAYLACGVFFAQLFGLDGHVSWLLFVLAWPVPLGTVMVMVIFALTISMSCARALVR